jgi:cell division protein FtsN
MNVNTDVMMKLILGLLSIGLPIVTALILKNLAYKAGVNEVTKTMGAVIATWFILFVLGTCFIGTVAIELVLDWNHFFVWNIGSVMCAFALVNAAVQVVFARKAYVQIGQNRQNVAIRH